MWLGGPEWEKLVGDPEQAVVREAPDGCVFFEAISGGEGYHLFLDGELDGGLDHVDVELLGACAKAAEEFFTPVDFHAPEGVCGLQVGHIVGEGPAVLEVGGPKSEVVIGCWEVRRAGAVLVGLSSEAADACDH